MAFSDRTLLVFDCLLSIVLSGLTRFSGLILYISYLSPRIRLFLRNQTGLFSGKLNFKIEVWMLGMLIYLGLVIVSRHFNKVNYVGRDEKHPEIYYIPIQR